MVGARYALTRLRRALDAAANHSDADVRTRAEAKVDAWLAVLDGLAEGRLEVGSRAPVDGLPSWVTLEIVHGGFATGRALAEGPLQPHERDLLVELPADAPGGTDRERLNLYFLSDAGLSRLSAAVRGRRCRVELPEEGALPVLAALLDAGFEVEALALLEDLRPFMQRLRLYPRIEPSPRPAGAVVRLSSVGDAAHAVQATRELHRLMVMNEAIRVWNPLYDRLVALWLDTVEGETPRLSDDGVEGGWPCRRWPDDWAARRRAWLDDYREAAREHRLCTKHAHRRSNFGRLYEALELCPEDSSALDGRAVGWIRRALANTVSRHGEPDSEQRTSLRSAQAANMARPRHTDIAEVVAGRLDAFPDDGGLPSLAPIEAPVGPGEHPRVPVRTAIPRSLVNKAARALEAPIEELVERGIIGSAEVLAHVLPQITADVVAAGLSDPALRTLFAQIYAAFRRRRTLLLLHLERQVQLDELPWIAALAPLRSDHLDAREQARQTLQQVSTLALTAFPHTILPNPLVTEMSALAEGAKLDLPFTGELAADIFMGTFTVTWTQAAAIAAELVGDRLYGRYYDLVGDDWRERVVERWGKRADEGFAARCRARAVEAGSGGGFVARNGTVIEQSMVLTTHNLAPLVEGLDLVELIEASGVDLADACFAWLVRRLAQPTTRWGARLRAVKNAAYAWRQGIFFLSFVDPAAQRSVVDRLEARLATEPGDWARRFQRAVEGLRHVIDGGRFEPDGAGSNHPRARRFLGWSAGRHWLMGD